MRVEDLQRIQQNQINNNTLLYASNSGNPYSCGILDIASQISGVTGVYVINSQLNAVSGVLSAQITSTGSILYNLINSSSAGVSSLNGQSGILNLTGAGNTSVIINGQTITISGDNSATLPNTIVFITGNQIISGNKTFVASLLDTNGISSLTTNSRQLFDSSSNGILDWENKTLNNVGGIRALNWSGYFLKDSTNFGVLDWNNHVLSGIWKINGTGIATSSELATTGTNLYNLINNFSGNQQCFTTGIVSTGLNNYSINYPLGVFSKIPKVLVTVEISGNNMYNLNITGRTPTGFFALFSDIVSEPGVVLNCLATIN